MSFRLPLMGIRQLWHHLAANIAASKSSNYRNSAANSQSTFQIVGSMISADWCEVSHLGEDGCLMQITSQGSICDQPHEPFLGKSLRR